VEQVAVKQKSKKSTVRVKNLFICMIIFKEQITDLFCNLQQPLK
jgi:hypothetical protein